MGKSHPGGVHHGLFSARYQSPGLNNAPVAAAAAVVLAHGVDHFRFGGVGRLGQEGRRRHDLPRLAPAALRHLGLQPGLLHRVQLAAAVGLGGGQAL